MEIMMKRSIKNRIKMAQIQFEIATRQYWPKSIYGQLYIWWHRRHSFGRPVFSEPVKVLKAPHFWIISQKIDDGHGWGSGPTLEDAMHDFDMLMKPIYEGFYER